MKAFIIKAVGRVVFRSKGFFSAVLSSFCYSRETHPPGSDSHGCLTLHFAKNSNEKIAKSLKPTLPTDGYKVIAVICFLAVCLAAGLMPLSSTWAADPRVLTLEQALDITSEKNRDIEKAREYLNWVQGKYVEERAAALPQLKLTGSGTIQQDRTLLLGAGGSLPDRIKSYSAEVGVTQTLFKWGQIGAAIRAAKEGMMTAEEQLRGFRQAAFRDVSVTFYDVLLARELKTIARQDLEQKERHLDEARRKYAAGVATEYEVLAAGVAVENARPAVIRSENNIRDTLDRLCFLLACGREMIDVTGSLNPVMDAVPGYEVVYATAIEKRPEVRDLQHRLSIAGEMITIASAEDKPSLEFRGGYGTKGLEIGDFKLDGKAWNAGLYLTFPFFDGLRTRGVVSQAESDRRSLMIDQAKLADSIALQAREALNSVRESEEIVSALSGTVTEAEKLLFLSEKGYELGVKIRLEVEDAELKLLQARVNLSRAWRDYRAARINLLWVMGVLGEQAV